LVLERARDAAWFRQRDASLSADPKLRLLRLVAEVEQTVVVGRTCSPPVGVPPAQVPAAAQRGRRSV